MHTDVRLFYQTLTSIAADWHNVSVVAWFAPAPLEAVQQLVRQIATASAAYPNGFVHLVVLAHGGQPPSDEIRRLISGCMRKHSERLLGVGIIVFNDGFEEAIHRSVVTSILRAAREPWPQKVFKTIEDAADWTEELLRSSGEPRPAAQIAAVLRSIVAYR